MSCSSNKVIYPSNNCPEVTDSEQLLYNGPALSCINVQTNNPLNDIFKKINNLFCKDCTFSNGTVVMSNCNIDTIDVTPI